MKRFEGKTALVTGASRGIGREIALQFAREGANLVLCATDEEAVKAVAKECEAFGAGALAVKCDVSKEEQVKAMVDSAMEKFGRIDILVNNAGITKDGLMMKMSEQDFDDVIAINLKGSFLCMKAVSRIMMKQRYGRIVNISSVVGILGNAGQVNYSASKAGIIGMTKSVARELVSRGITVNAVAPGFIATEMTEKMSDSAKELALSAVPMAKMGQTSHIAKAVAFLASDDAEYITGQVLAVDGGMSM